MGEKTYIAYSVSTGEMLTKCKAETFDEAEEKFERHIIDCGLENHPEWDDFDVYQLYTVDDIRD